MSAFDPDAPAAAEAGLYGLATAEADARVVILPVPFEATVSYGGGAARGPAAILDASRQVDLYDLETGRPYEQGIFMRPIPEALVELNRAAREDAERIIEAGGETGGDPALIAALERVNRAGEAVNEHTYAAAKALLAEGKIVGLIGGDHSVPFGAIRAHAEHYGEIGVLHLDAHADLREAYEGFTWSHASIMERVLSELPGVSKLVQVGIRDLGERELATIQSSDRIRTYFDPAIARARLSGRLGALFADAVRHLPERVYLSFDIDGLDPRFCPGTGTPVPGGLDPAEVSLLMEAVVEAGKTIVGFDLCEVAPRPDDEWDGNVGARLLYKMIGWTLQSRGPTYRALRQVWDIVG